jgi:hypothetical protein
VSQLSKATHSLSNEYCTRAPPHDPRLLEVVLHPSLVT